MGMNSKKFLRVFLAVLCISILEVGVSWTLEENIRYPHVAGSFYPADKEELAAMVDRFLAAAPSQEKLGGPLTGIIVPHAGYPYSGPTAAYAYKLIEGKKIDTVVLVGPYHWALFPGASVWRSGQWRTPLGWVPVDTELAGAIVRENAAFGYNQEIHRDEHSLEAQIPFLQRTLKDFKIVPILVNEPSLANCRLLAKAIVKNISGKNAVVVVSTDMSHYHPDAVARTMDRRVLKSLEERDSEGLLLALSGGNGELCGGAAAVTGLEIARLTANRVKVLKYSTSGDATGDLSSVVGYGASAIYKEAPADPIPQNPKQALNAAEKAELLKIARKTLETYFTEGKAPEFNAQEPVLKEDRAVFVTLREGGKLRGCIGRFLPEEPLYRAVSHMAIESATEDPRFRPVAREELDKITIEISVLGIPQKVKSADEIMLGRDGVLIKKWPRSGIFLPKVAAETGWSKEDFLSGLCTEKAGLPADCWKDPEAELYTFTAEDFGESSGSI